MLIMFTNKHYPFGRALPCSSRHRPKVTRQQILLYSPAHLKSLRAGFSPPSVDFWALFDLDETQNTTLSVSFEPSIEANEEPETRLDIDFIKITVSDPRFSYFLFL